ncbi:hypothetical protein [Nocardia sp. NPDC004711]
MATEAGSANVSGRLRCCEVDTDVVEQFTGSERFGQVVTRSQLPARTVVLALTFTDRRPADRFFWLHVSPTGVNLCRDDTGAPVDVWLTAPTAEVTRWWIGELSWHDLQEQPGVALHGDPALRRRIPRWFTRYVFTPESLAASDEVVRESK